MKKLIISTIALCLAIGLQAQAPQKFSYQAVVRDGSGNSLASKSVSFQISILQDSANGNAAYTETHTATSNTQGMVTLQIGGGSTTDDFSAIKWEYGSYYLKVEMDAAGGSNYALYSTSQLLSVPYALRAEDAGQITLYGAGTTNPGKMVVQHSLAFPTWGLQYNDQLDQFSFIRAESLAAMTVDLTQRKVGIKTTPGVIPSADLEVNGTVKITGGNPGADKILVSDADGLTSWNTSLNLNSGVPIATALKCNGDEALWYNGTYYSWGYGGTYNYFSDAVTIGTAAAPGYNLVVNGTAAKTGGGSWTVLSDIRLKNISGNYDKGLREIVALQPVKFFYKEDNPRELASDEEQIGFIAQDVQKVFPEAVNEAKDGYLDFNMHAVNVALVNAVKELKAENDELKARLTKLEALMEEKAGK